MAHDRLTDEDLEQRDEIVDRLNTAAAELTASIEAFNDWRQARREQLNYHIHALRDQIEIFNQDSADKFGELIEPERIAFNEMVDEANEWLIRISNGLEAYAESQSDAWLESEEGVAHDTLCSEWSFELDQLDVEEPPPLEDIEVEDIEDLDLDHGQDDAAPAVSDLPTSP